MQVDQHPVNHVFSVFVKRLCLTHGSALCFKACKNRQISWTVVSVSHASASVHADGSTHRSSFQVACVSIKPSQVNHRLTQGSIEIVLLRELGRLLQIVRSGWPIPGSYRQLTEELKNHALV